MFVEEVELAVGRKEGGVWIPAGTRSVLALCDAIWAVHPDGIDPDVMEPLFKITHRPTGLSASGGMAWYYALAMLREIHRSGVDWTFTNPNDAKKLSVEWAAIRKAAQASIGGAWLPDGGFNCTACGHKHSGRALAFICIGCPCVRTTAVESAATSDAVDPHADSTGNPSTRV